MNRVTILITFSSGAHALYEECSQGEALNYKETLVFYLNKKAFKYFKRKIPEKSQKVEEVVA